MSKNNEYAYVFDYTVGEIYEIKLKAEDADKEVEDILIAFNLSIDNCYVMFTEQKCKIKNITRQRNE